MDEAGSRIVKRDAVGRVSYGRERREAIPDGFERSGLKGVAFARLAGLSYQTFASWIQRRRHERGDYRMKAAAPCPPSRREPEPTRLVEAVIAGSGDSGEKESASVPRVEPRCGALLLVENERQAVLAARILEALASGGPC